MKKKKTKELKEERTMIDTPTHGGAEDFFRKVTKSLENEKGDKYDKRANLFWNELFGIIELLNRANPRNSISDIHNPTITNYLLWRILTELKLSREDNQLEQLKKTELRNKLEL